MGDLNTALIVERDEELREALADCLMLEGFQSPVALASEAAAIAYLSASSHRPTVILLDVLPLGTRPSQLVAWLRERPDGASNVILMAGKWPERPALEMEALSRLEKPFGFRELRRALHALRDAAAPGKGVPNDRPGESTVTP